MEQVIVFESVAECGDCFMDFADDLRTRIVHKRKLVVCLEVWQWIEIIPLNVVV